MLKILKIVQYSLFPLFILIPVATGATQQKLYLITTASSGFGIAISETLAAEGNSLILAGRDEKKLTQLKSRLEAKYKGEYFVELFDYSDSSSIANLGNQLKKYQINGIVLIPPRIKINTSEIPTTDEWETMFKMGFIAPLEIIKNAVPALQDESSIVIISGLSSINYIPEYKNTNVLRKMWVAEAKNLVYQFSSQKIRVNCISPNVILTDYHMNKIKDRAMKNQKTIDELLAEETISIPLHRYGEPQDIAEATAFLLSKKSSYINGTNIAVDGGLNKSY